MDFDTLIRFSKQFGLVWFFVLFVAIVAWAYWPGNKKRFEQEGRSILEDVDEKT
ncbi:MAG: cbb3-type cytochrome c oxidase subunit 3 [Magnetococcales bacterium]|nr:cbb3-type cytochrome c oxidase subunit 3 [Magnetococcales bacterium]NGZ06896.1 cbb3-type cytochrome c oxidase subunit 3 [Magnetococcales bacterium]